MANYKIERDAQIKRHIEAQVNLLTSRMVDFNVPAFPLTVDRVENLINPPKIMTHIDALRHHGFKQFNTGTQVILAFDNFNTKRGISANFFFSRGIVKHTNPEVNPGSSARTVFEKALKLDPEKLSPVEVDAMREWIVKAAEWRRKEVLVNTTVKLVLDTIESTYALTATWPFLAKLIDGNNKSIGYWRTRFADSPRSPQNYNILPRIRDAQQMPQRIASAEHLLLKAEFTPKRDRPGERFYLLHWTKLPSDPFWLSA